MLVLALVAMSFWYELTGDTHGLVFEQGLTREDHVASAMEAAAAKAAAFAATGAVLERKEDKRALRHHETDDDKAQRTLSDVYINAALVGEHWTSAAYWSDARPIPKHTRNNCNHSLPNGAPCHSNLWEDGKDGLRKHLEEFAAKKRKKRSQDIFDEFSPCSHFAPPLPDGRMDPSGKPDWHFFMNSRTVCQDVYVMNNPIGNSTLDALKARYIAKRPTAHNTSEPGWAPVGSIEYDPTNDWKRISIIGWYQYYSKTCGDYMPDDDVTIIPACELKHEHDLFCAERNPAEHVHYSYWVDTWNNAPELARIGHARRTLNFQHCGLCVEWNAKVAAAYRTGDVAKITEAKSGRSGHHSEARGERACYYQRRESGRDPLADTASIILDKWDSAKCTVPYFARKPAAWWNGVSKNVLAQHVLGVMVHANPKNKVYLFTFNDSVASGANNNIEGIRRTLFAEYAGRCLPRTLYIQSDNASDNKCWTVLLFLGMLVYHNYTVDIYFSFLLVGHTHEDIDALFAVISRHFRSIPNHSISGKTPQSFQEEMSESLTEKFVADCQAMEWVLDWDAHLKPHKHPDTTGIGHVDIEAEPDEGARSPHQFWIHRRESDGAVVFHYKELSAHTVWLPSIDPDAKPLVTNPEGIELFDSKPIDPVDATSMPAEVELRTAEVQAAKKQNTL